MFKNILLCRLFYRILDVGVGDEFGCDVIF